MDSAQSVIEWIEQYPAALWIAALAFVLLLAGLHFLMQHLRRMDAAMRVVDNQFNPASADAISELVDWAEQRQRKSLVLEGLANVRRHHGHAGVKLGHLYWLMDAVLGDKELQTVPPSFSKRSSSPER